MSKTSKITQKFKNFNVLTNFKKGTLTVEFDMDIVAFAKNGLAKIEFDIAGTTPVDHQKIINALGVIDCKLEEIRTIEPTPDTLSLVEFYLLTTSFRLADSLAD